MYEIDTKLIERKKNPIRAGLVGAGSMGTEISTQIGDIIGMELPIIVDITKEKAKAGFKNTRKKKDIVFTNSIKEASEFLHQGKYIASTNYQCATALPQIDTVVDATGSTEMGAHISMDAIHYKKNIVMMSVECDITIGPLLRRLAEEAEVIYSLAAGDEPAAIIELYRFAKALGLDIIAAGKGKNNPLNLYATPRTVKQKAEERNMNPYMLCEFVDGSKTAIEMTAVSNATGLKPDIPGMHGPKATPETLHNTFVPKENGGILNNSGVVDFAIGVAPGVFLIVKNKNTKMRDSMNHRTTGKAPYYSLYRPYHLCSLEVPITIAQGVIYRESTGHPLPFPTSECIAVAKQPIKKGTRLDKIGGYFFRASITTVEDAKEHNYIPLGLAPNAITSKDIAKDEIITYDMVTLDNSNLLVTLRRLQDSLCVNKGGKYPGRTEQ